MKNLNKKNKIFFIIGAIVLLGITFVVSLKMGSVDITLGELIKGIITGNSEGNLGIIKDLRMPRVIVAMLVGGNLAIAGVLLQAVIRNPLADPYVTGISTGACMVTVFFMVTMPTIVTMRPIFGFLGGLISCFIVYFMSFKENLSPMRIVLAGAAVNGLFTGISSMLTISTGMGAANIQNWIMGSLATIRWSSVYILSIYSLIGIVGAVLLGKLCNIVVLGSKNTKSLGFDSNLAIIVITLVAVFLASISTAIAGAISFVGLIVPHICRMIIGWDHKYLIPFTGVVGAILLLVADTLGRMIMRPYEIPAGIVMAIIGAPFFLYLLRKSDMK